MKISLPNLFCAVAFDTDIWDSEIHMFVFREFCSVFRDTLKHKYQKF